MTISPWLFELQRQRPVHNLLERAEADVTIIGGGIAGMSTAFYLLTSTSMSVALLEKGSVGHGASGHNGGQAVAGIERPLSELYREIGGQALAEMLWAIDGGHQMVQEMCESVAYRGVKVKGQCFMGFQDERALKRALDEMSLRIKIGAPVRELLMADDVPIPIKMPEAMKGLLHLRPREEISRVMRSKDEYLACASIPVTLLNSAQLCEDLAVYLLSTFPERFRLYEGSPVREVDVRGKVRSTTSHGSVISDKVVLCTNGYPLPRVIAAHRPVVEDGSRQFLASMVAYRPEGTDQMGAFIFHHDEGDAEEEPYFYLTRRPTKFGNAEMVAVGGPQVLFSGEPEGDREIPPGVYDRIDDFASRTYLPALPDYPEMYWNGLMGYTQDGLRLVGPDPKVPSIWYNLGCNGIGLLPSIVGGRNLAERMSGEVR